MINTISFPALNLSFTINRVAFSVFNRSVYWYGIIIACAMIVGLFYILKQLTKEGINPDDISNMALLAIPAAIVCARLYYVLFSFNYYKNNIAEIFQIWNGGLAIYGGAIGTFLTIFFYCRVKKLSCLQILDTVVVAFILGQAVGRWGNFVNCEAYGSVTSLPFGMTIESNGTIIAKMVHPTFFYESMWNIVGFLLLLFYKNHKKFVGEVFLLYIAWYGLGRFFIEGLRTDSLMLGSLRISQCLAFTSFILSLVLIVFIRRKKPCG